MNTSRSSVSYGGKVHKRQTTTPRRNLHTSHSSPQLPRDRPRIVHPRALQCQPHRNVSIRSRLSTYISKKSPLLHSMLKTGSTPDDLTRADPDYIKKRSQSIAQNYETFNQLLEKENRKVSNRLTDICKEILLKNRQEYDPFHNLLGYQNSRHLYSRIQPMLFSSNEFPSHVKELTIKFLRWTGLKRFTDMLIELWDDFVDYLNQYEPFGQRKKDRKYRLNNRLNKPFARWELEPKLSPHANWGPPEERYAEYMAYNLYKAKYLDRPRSVAQKKQEYQALERLKDPEDAHYKDLQVDYWNQQIENERRAIELKRKARDAMGLPPDATLETRWNELMQFPQSQEQGLPEKEFEQFRKQFVDDEEKRKAQRKQKLKQSRFFSKTPGLQMDPALYTKSRRLIIDPTDGLPMFRDDLEGHGDLPIHFMPADEEDMDALEQLHWRRKIKEATKRKYFSGGWKYDGQFGTGPLLIAPQQQNRDERIRRMDWEVEAFGVDGHRGPENDQRVYDFIYGTYIRSLVDIDGVGTHRHIGLFQIFPDESRTPVKEVEYTGTKELTYDPKQNHITKWELRKQWLKFKISMSPLGDLGRWLWRLYNIDMFPFTHFRMPFAFIMTQIRYARGLRHALSRWSKTATHSLIDERFAYQSNRYGEHQNKDIFHYVNEYDYLKEYMLPIVVRAIRECDFDVLRSACSEHATYNIVKWLHIQDRFGIYHESRLNYWVESLDFTALRKNEHGKLVLEIEFVLVEPPYFYNSAGGQIFSDRIEYRFLYRPRPLAMAMTLIRDYEHPDFDYQVINFECDARRVKRVFNDIERIYHVAQRRRTQYYQAPKFYAVRRTMGNSYWTRRNEVVNSYNAQIENPVFWEKELEFTKQLEARHNEMTQYKDVAALGKYITALQLDPVMDFIVDKVQSHPVFSLHPIQRDKQAYWESRKELDLIKFRQREARRIRAKQNTLHRYFHRLRSAAHLQHTYDHGGTLDEFRRLHIDKLATDANADDWVQKWIVDPERRGRPYFKNNKRFHVRYVKRLLRKRRRQFTRSRNHTYLRTRKAKMRFTKRLKRYKRRRFPGGHYRKQRRRYQRRKRKFGHNMKKKRFKKRRRFMPFMERVYARMPRGAFNEYNRLFHSRNARMNRFLGKTTPYSTKQKGPGYSKYDTTWYEKWHVWDGGFYNPNEFCYTKADVFNPENNPFEPRRVYLLSFLEDSTFKIPFYAYRNWDLPWRLPFPGPWHRKPRQWTHLDTRTDKRGISDDYSYMGPEDEREIPFEDLPNAQLFTKNDSTEKDWRQRRQWPKPEDDKWDI